MTSKEAQGERAKKKPRGDLIAGEYLTASQLISAFRETDRLLTDALEDDDLDFIRQLGRDADLLIEQMLICPCETKSDRKLLLQFLVERFILEEGDTVSLRKRICDQLLAEVDS